MAPHRTITVRTTEHLRQKPHRETSVQKTTKRTLNEAPHLLTIHQQSIYGGTDTGPDHAGNPENTQENNEPQSAMATTFPTHGIPLANLELANNLESDMLGYSASLDLHESDNDSDPEIREAQRELQTLRKQRKLAII